MLSNLLKEMSLIRVPLNFFVTFFLRIIYWLFYCLRVKVGELAWEAKGATKSVERLNSHYLISGNYRDNIAERAVWYFKSENLMGEEEDR